MIYCLHIFSINYKKQTSLFVVFQIGAFWFDIMGHIESSLDLKQPLQALSKPTFPIPSHLKHVNTKAKFNQKDHIWDASLLYQFLCNCPHPSVYQHVNHSVATTTHEHVLETQHHTRFVLLSMFLISQLPAKLKGRPEQEHWLARRSALVIRQITSRQTSCSAGFSCQRLLTNCTENVIYHFYDKDRAGKRFSRSYI